MTDRTLDIFSNALDLQGDERRAYLDRACGDDAALRDEVDQLIRAEVEAGDFLNETSDLSPDPTGGMFAQIGERAGDVIGRYKLLQQIGEGGFGVVFMAEQSHPVRRRVALKVIKLGMDTKQVVARFEAERQALAMMDHPNIARVLDAGATESGRPYFVMELVKGVPITEYCDANKLSTRERLELFSDVCAAVQHAHQQGVIHRDIKPTNVLVTLHDGRPVPKVIDFGIAKATSARLTEKTLFTEFRQFIGTPEYVSPEQAEYSGLGVDTRSDVYSLGVLLYELLTGVTPFDTRKLLESGLAEIQRVLREEDPPAPSTRVRTLGASLTEIAAHRSADPVRFGASLRGELDWIVLKAIEKDRRRRYDSASALAQDVRRHLAGDVVEASPASGVYRMRKSFRRHRSAFLSGGAVAVALVAGLVGTSLMSVRADAARDDAVAQFSEAELARQEAEALNDYFMTLFGEVGWMAPGEAGQTGATELTVNDLLRRAVLLAPDAFEGKPLLEANVRDALSRAAFALGDVAMSREQGVAITGLFEEAGLADDDPRVIAREIGTLLPASAYVWPREDIDRAMALEAQLRDRLQPGDELLMQAAESIGHTLSLSNRRDDAIAFIDDRLGDLDWDALSLRARESGLRTRTAMAIALEENGQYERAERELVAVIDRSMSGLARGYAQIALGTMRTQRGLPEAGAPLYEQGLDAYRLTLGERHPYTLSMWSGMALVLVNEGQPDRARTEVQLALTAVVDRFGEGSTEATFARMGASFVALVNGEIDQSVSHLDSATGAIEGLRGSLPPGVPETFEFFLSIDRASAARMAGDYEIARVLVDQAIDILDNGVVHAAVDRGEVWLYRELGHVRAALGDEQGARAAFERARDAAIATDGERGPIARWIDLDLAAIDAGTLDPSKYLQDGWIAVSRKGG